MVDLRADGAARRRLELVAWVLVGLGLFMSRMYQALIRDVMFFDESQYLAQAAAMVERGVTNSWAWNPGAALLDALFYLPFKNVALGLDYASRAVLVLCGIVAYGLMALIVRRLTGNRLWALGALAFVFVAAPFWRMLLNSSDLFYMVLVVAAILALDIALRKAPGHWSWLVAAALLAYSSAVRNDGTVFYAAAGLVYAIVLWRSPITWERRLMHGLLWLMPLLLILALYQGVAVARGGYYNPYFDIMEPRGTSVAERSYIAFEQGEGRVQRYFLEDQGKTWWGDGRLLAEELYGTAEENGDSILRAITRNPGAWLNRLRWNLRDFFLSWQDAFLDNGPPLFVAALWGWGLMWRRRPRSALVFLLGLAPTLFFFLLTFWQPRYVITLMPVWTALGIYALFAVTQPTQPGERPWSIGLALLSGVAIAVFAYLGMRYGPTLPTKTLLLTLLLITAFIWRFCIKRGLSRRALLVLAGTAFLLLALGTLRAPPRAEWTAGPYHYESSAYIAHAFTRHAGDKTCFGGGDLDALSLIWYARQSPVLLPASLPAGITDGSVREAMAREGCRRLLIAQAGWSDPALKDQPKVLGDAIVLFRSNEGRIVLLEFPEP